MKPNLLLLLLAILVCCHGRSFASEQELSKEELLTTYYDIIKILITPQSYEGSDNSKFKKDIFVIYKEDKDRFGKRVAVIGKDSKIKMVLEPFTGQVLEYENRFLREKNSRGKTLFKHGEQPKRDKKEIIKEAEKYAKILNRGSVPEGYKIDDARFVITTHLNSEFDYAGYWSSGGRKLINGYGAEGYSFTIILDDNLGLEFYYFVSPIDYVLPNKINITKNKAVDLARQLGTELINDKEFHFYDCYRGFKLGKVTDVYAMFMIPNCINHRYIPPESIKPPSRLLWEVTFETMPENKTSKGSGWLASFCIDAESGELAGFR
ncbi:MAG: hypothetical protein WC486_00490 [Candidatus Omnitrophota bacterium]